MRSSELNQSFPKVIEPMYENSLNAQFCFNDTETREMKGNKLLMGLSCFVLVACNAPPSRIAPVYQSTDQYEKHDCRKLTRQLSQIDTIILAQKSQLQSDANIDTGIVAGSILLLPLGLFALEATGNGDLKNEYAQNLGKQAALRQTIDAKSCDI